MVTTITEVLNIWNEMGVFSYVIPFLLIFAVVFAILDKTKILSGKESENRGILAIISIAIGLLALQFDFVSEFFAVIFPRFGVGLALFLVLIIILGFFWPQDDNPHGSWIGYVIGIGVAIWALSSWDEWSAYSGFGGWFVQNVWSIIVLGVVIAVIFIVKGKKK
jgi:peptidoglycan/LPS O-acetylase OafA/YrhL